ncbi:MAG: squalene/phytoene synthase family protein [Gemmatimonadetes bacterium]|nr:squalene/phytoene synthase family protein [Gemmatimonadota bacterium]
MAATDTPARVRAAEAFGREVLPAVSRTFALSVQLLRGELGRSVLCAYLLCRIADTIEDDGHAAPDDKARLLGEFLACLDDAAAADAFPTRVRHIEGDAAHVRLLRSTDLVCVLFRSLPEGSRACVAHWVREMGRGMAAFTLRHPAGLRIQTVEEYREYCYYVAGTVGCMLTELWREHGHVPPARYDALWARCKSFGEALQTVNILKDIAADAERENAIYIPESTLRAHGASQATLLDPACLAANRAAVGDFIALAWTDLDLAFEYLLLLPRRAVSIRAFCVLPMLYAYATLRELSHSDAMLRPGGVVKISRAEVRALMAAGLAALGSNTLLRRLVSSVRTRPFAPFAATASAEQ